MIERLEDLIRVGQSFNFSNNSSGNFSRPSDNLLAWIANVEHYIIENYDENSGPFNLFKTYVRSELSGNYQTTFDRQLSIIRGALISCRQIPPKKRRTNDDNSIISLLKNPIFWTTIVLLTGSAFSLGLNIGSTKFDKEKSDFYLENTQLKIDINKYKKGIIIKDSLIIILQNKIKEKK